MIYLKRHRLIDEIEKKRNQGQIIHFLTGDGINDNLFYGIREGILTIADSLKQYYLKDNEEFDYFINVVNSKDNIHCYENQRNGIVEINFENMFPAPKVKSVLSMNGSSKPSKDDNINQQANNVQQNADNSNSRVNRLNELIKKGQKRILIFLENLEWIANLHESQADTTWISMIQLWQKSKNLLIIATIKDMEPLKKYNFEQEETFISNPTAEEIKYSYLRYILRNTTRDYHLNMSDLDDISHSLSVGKKNLCACMRILRKIIKNNHVRFRVEDFKDSIERMIEEKVSWEKVRLDNKIKRQIKNAVENFMKSDEKNPPLKGLILTGPPGTGKTLIAKALANEIKCYFMSPTLADLKGEYIGQSSAKVKRIFAEARGNAPTILFIDEADTVFPSRSLGSVDKDSYTMDMVNQFLQEIDGAQTGKQKIFTIAATNRPEAIDSAVKSRLSKEPINIPLPPKEMRQLIFDDNLSMDNDNFTLKGKYFEDKVLTKSENMSGRDISTFVKNLKTAAKESGIKLGNNQETEQLFDLIFQMKEDYFIEESTSLGIFSKDNIIKPSENHLKFSNIIGYDDLKEKIASQVDYIRSNQSQKRQYDDFGIKPQKGVLMYGPPGNGKSVLAKATAGEYGFYFFKVLSRDFATFSDSEQIKNLERIFTEIVKFSKMIPEESGIVLFFDEFDSLAGQSLNQVVRGSLLNYIADEEHGIRNRNSKILFMVATNNYYSIDEAVKRQGRIDAHLFMDDPTREDGARMLKSFFDKDNKIETVSSSLITDAYNNLLAEKQNRKRREELSEHYSGLAENELPEINRRILQRKIDENGRPSGAELETLYKELKEIAFRRRNIKDKKLIIDSNVVNKRFLNQNHSA